MLLSHVSFALGLIALVAGVSLYLWSVRAEAGPGIGLAKVVGVIVIILAIIELICSAYSAIMLKHHVRGWRNQNNNSVQTNSDNSSNTNSTGDTSINNQINNPNAPKVPPQNPTPAPTPTQPSSSS
jgi:uncharacterized membrane protein